MPDRSQAKYHANDQAEQGSGKSPAGNQTPGLFLGFRAPERKHL